MSELAGTPPGLSDVASAEGREDVLTPPPTGRHTAPATPARIPDLVSIVYSLS